MKIISSFKILSLILIFTLLPKLFFAVPAYPHPVEYQLPDGSVITILLKGDERVHWAQTIDGYTLMRNQDGFYEYAILDENGDLAASGIQALNESERTAAETAFLSSIRKDLRYSDEQIGIMLQIRDMNNSFAEKLAEREAKGESRDFVGEVSAPVILVGFQGKPFTKTKADFEALMNQVNYSTGGATGSVHDYFLASSYGQLQFTVDVFGPYTLANAISYYDDECGGDPRQMTREAAQAAHDDGCNFANYDLDNDGNVDGLHIIFAGYGQEAGAAPCQSIWSHAWYVTYPSLYLDGKRIYRYSCSPELRNTWGSNITYMGVIAHELSHVFGLPDLYDTDYMGSGGESVDIGPWDIMASGSWNDDGRTPAYHSAWCKDFLGWVHTTTLSDPISITLPNPEMEGVSYRINTTTNNEYFLVENRQETEWDVYIPGSGLLIYHVDENYSGWDNNCINCNPSHRGLYIKQANGGNGSASYHSANTPYPTSSNSSFTDTSSPNSKSWAGANTNKPITNITRNTAERTVAFDFMGGGSASYTIAASANPTAGGNVAGAGVYENGETATLTATANPYYTFVNWTENGNPVSTNAVYSFTVTSNRTLVANFIIDSYNVAASANPTAGGSIAGAGSYDHGATATLTATANAGYTFVNWTENGNPVSTNSSYSFTVTSDRTFVANFSINSYTIVANVNPAEGGSVVGAGSYEYGATATLTATANTGYTFVNWTENGNPVSTNATYSFTVMSDRTLTAHFTLISYTIAASANPTAGGNIAGAGNYNHGATATLTATENIGYTFANWTENGAPVSTDAVYSFTVTSNRTLVANFTLNSYAVVANANPTEGGSVSGAGNYNHGATATLTATATGDYAFINWTENGNPVSINATYSFTVTSDRTLTANFSTDFYVVSAEANPEAGGSVSGAGNYLQGATVTLTATANVGYAFVNWTEDGASVSTNATYSFTVTSDRDLVANFSINSYNIAASANPTAGGSISGTGSYDYGETATLTATANAGYAFVNWTENGNSVSTNTVYSFTVTSARILVANFKINSYTIAASANPTTGGSVAGSGSYNHGATATLKATANAGYTFANWTENGGAVSANATYSFTVTSDRTLIANFLSSNANLKSLTVSAGDLTPAFNANTTNYKVNVENNVTTISIVGVAQHDKAVVSGNVTNAPLNVGENSFNIVVTAENGTATKSYAVVVTRAAASYEIKAGVSGTGGSISPAGTITVPEGDNQKFTITPDNNYSIQRVLVDGENNLQAVEDGFYTFEDVRANHTIEAIFAPLSIEKIADGIKIYPNPANNYVIIESDNIINEIMIYDAYGKKMLEKKNSELKSLQINLTAYPSGVYYIMIDGKSEKVIKR